MFELTTSDVTIVADAVVAILDIASAALAVAILYIVAVGHALRRDERPVWLYVRVSSFFLCCAASLTATHLLIQQQRLLAATVFLLVAGLICLTVYWTVVKIKNVAEDMRIPYVMMVWGALWLLALGALNLIWIGRTRLRLEADVKISLDIIVQSAGIVMTATAFVFAYLMKAGQANATARHQIYQTLEMQSIELFRFEAEEAKLVQQLWQGEDLSNDEVKRYQLKQYVCQMLNLFEMAYRFRKQNIVPADVFGSWVIWIWELCCNPVFEKLWESTDELPLNYIREFREVIDQGIEISKKNGLDARAQFFQTVGEKLHCAEVRKWLEPSRPAAPQPVRAAAPAAG